jgi:hypothetical protein
VCTTNVPELEGKRRVKNPLQKRSATSRAKSLANLKPFKKGERRAKQGGRHGKPTDLLPISTQRELVTLARDYTHKALARIIQIATGKGFKPKDPLAACNILLERGWGRAPIFVKIAGDEAANAPPRDERSDAQRQSFAKEVMSILIDCGELKPPDGYTFKRERDETIVESDEPRRVEPEVLDPTHAPTREQLLRAANVAPVERPPPRAQPTPTHFKASDESDARCESLIISATTITMDPDAWRAKMRPMLRRYAEREPDERERVSIATLDARFGA